MALWVMAGLLELVSTSNCFLNGFLTGKHFMFNEAYYYRWLYRFYQENFLFEYFIWLFLLFFYTHTFQFFLVYCTADGSCTLAQIAGAEKSLVCMSGASLRMCHLKKITFGLSTRMLHNTLILMSTEFGGGENLELQ